MAFRADDAAESAYQEVESYLIGRLRDVPEATRIKSRHALQDIVEKLGPAIRSYPRWHPLVSHHDPHDPTTTPGERCGYRGLDHTRYFVNGFITCPYDDGQEVLDSVEALPLHPAASVTAERLEGPFYNSNATPILVRCEWHKPISPDCTVPLSIAMALLLEKEVPCWQGSQVAETWESMRPYFLGTPHGARSSLFVSQETGQAMKKIWEAIIYTGMFGPIMV